MKDGGSAFPQIQTDLVGSQGEYHPEVSSVGGMTLRDYFAAKAMQATIVHAIAGKGNSTPEQLVAIVAEGAYGFADAMLKAREA